MPGRIWTVKFSRKANKMLEKIPANYLESIFSSVDQIEIDPYSGDVKKLKGESNLYRKRVGTYRIVYSIYKDILYIEIIEILHRKDAYR